MSDAPTQGRRKAIPDHPAVFRFLSGHGLPGGPPPHPGPATVFLHIPKTGGTFLTDLILHNLQERDQPDLFYAPHWMSAARTGRIFGPDRRLALILRDPVARFRSAWDSRLARGRPAYDTPWSAAEEKVFARYPTLRHFLREAVHPNPRTRRRALKLMNGMALVPRGYAHAFGSARKAQALLPNITVCLPLEKLAPNLDQVMHGLGFAEYTLAPDLAENRASTRATPLSALDKRLLAWLLREDIRIHKLLMRHARTLHDL
ncbi:hypothetical protein [Oceanibium sediminis]|uniref:hypothetical protein n=1 Tax=Oceanibium sediminis TaxID=2026339 RepID=UPI000DD308CC|nr:hypothetical protein [Oceanibium sediminis]